MKLGISLHGVTPNGDSGVLAVAHATEQLGFDAIYMSGHVLGEPGETVLDPIVTLATVAGATSRLRIATSVLLLPHYNPVLLANEAASLDVLSEGRFVLAMGVGWNEAEFAALGVPFNERGVRADEYLEAMAALWNSTQASFSGRFVNFADVTLGTPPRTAGGPPVWIGGHSDAALRRALRTAKAWHGTGATPEEVAEVRGRLETFGAELGRDPGTLDLTGIYLVVPPVGVHSGFTHGFMLGGEKPSADSVAEDIGRLAEQGLSALNLLLAVTPDTFLDSLTWVAEEVLPKLPGGGA
jgi:probable F420-dependent oxidoreductase